MSNFLFPALIAAFAFSALSVVPAEWSNEKKYLPKVLKKVRFGMSFEKVKMLRQGLTKDPKDDYHFREVYFESVGKNGIESISYYFDNEGDLPLYEIIIVYESESVRDVVAAKKLGAPNYKEKEWKLDMDADYPLHAWTFKNKLIYAVPLKGSEWEDGI